MIQAVTLFPSIFDTIALKDFLVQHDGHKITLDQCMYGCGIRKRTGLVGNLGELPGLARLCDGSHQHLSQSRITHVTAEGKTFFTKQFETYPNLFCKALAQLIVNNFVRNRGRMFPRMTSDSVPLFFGAASHSCHARLLAQAMPARAVWPYGESRSFSDAHAAAPDAREVQRRSTPLQ